MKKQKLISDFQPNYDLFGLTSSVKDYKLAWSINKYLNLDLNRQKDHEVVVQSKVFSFTYFLDEPMNEIRLRLFSNKNISNESIDKMHLVPEYSHFDYIFMREGESQSFSIISLQESLKEVPVIEYLSPLELSKIKFKEHFAF